MRINLRLILFGGLLFACTLLPGMNTMSADSVAMLQTDNYFVAAEDSLRKMAVRIIEPRLDAERIENGLAFNRYFLEVINHEASFDYPFDSLSTVSLLTAPDSSFRIATWYIPLLSREHVYHGFLQFRDHIIELSDSTAGIEAPVYQELSAGQWFGSFYYEIIGADMGDYTLYTLLGWKGHNPETRMRIIEPLRIIDGIPVFGARVFAYEEEEVCRIVFEYAARASMNLVYEPHLVQGSAERIPLIAFDRLSPLDDAYVGQRAYYVPEANIVDAFVFSDGKWVYVSDIDARNPLRLPAAE